MQRSFLLVAAIIPAVAAGLIGYAAYHTDGTGWVFRRAVATEQRHDHEPGGASSGAAGRVLYWRHPDGQPEYAAEPRRTSDGRDYVPVYAEQDVEPEAPAVARSPAAAATAAAPDHAGHQAAAAAPPNQPDAAGGRPRRILYYRHPMGLPDTSPVPKKDSMGMDYIPVYEGEDEDGAVVRIAPGRVQASGVRSEPVARREVVRAVRAPGTVQLDERRVSVVALRTEAFIERVENVTTGDRVRRGQPLMRLYSAEVVAAGAQYVSTLNFPSGATAATADGARRRLENLGVPPDVLAEIERSRRIPHSFVWPVPRDGVVLERAAVEGMRAPAGEALFRLADLSVVWVLAEVPERDIGTVTPGQAVEVRPRGLLDRAFAGRVALIYPQFNTTTRTARVRVELANPDGALLPGMYAEVEIATSGGGAVIAVPDGAVIDSGTRRLVFLERGEGRYEPREVRTGRRGGGYVEVNEGLAEGDRVVVAANFLLDSESNLRAALRGLAAGAGQGEGAAR